MHHIAQAPIGTPGGDPVRIKDFELLVGNIISALTPIGGLILFVVVILAGYKFITSGGDPKKVAEASSTLTMAIAGAALLALAYLILVIISRLTGANILDFIVYR